MEREMGILRIPLAAEKVIKGTNAGSITEFKNAEDCVKRIDLLLSSSVKGWILKSIDSR